MKISSKIIGLSVIGIAITAFMPVVFAEFIPTLGPSTDPVTVASDVPEGTIIPTNTGVNGPEGGTTLIPTGTGANNPEGGTTLVPTIVGSNGPEETPVNPANLETPTTPSSGGGSFSSGGSSGYTMPIILTPTFATSTLSCPFLNGFVIPGKVNLPVNIAKVQLFLNIYNRAKLPVDGILSDATIEGVKSFQGNHLTDIMGPWGSNTPSGQVYITTLKEINSIVCASPKTLNPDEQAIINAYVNGTDQNGAIVNADGTIDLSNSTTTGTTTESINDNSDLTGSAINATGGFWSRIWTAIKNWFR